MSTKFALQSTVDSTTRSRRIFFMLLLFLVTSPPLPSAGRPLMNGVAAFQADAATSPRPPPSEAGWRLIWNDEFDGPENSSPDDSKWSYDLGGGGWGNLELEVYTKERANVFLDGKGHLAIRARRLEDGRYTSGRLKTLGKFSFQYGRV